MDAMGLYDRHAARSLGYVLDELAFRWFEDPLSDEDLEGWRELRRRLETPTRRHAAGAGSLDSDPLSGSPGQPETATQPAWIIAPGISSRGTTIPVDAGPGLELSHVRSVQPGMAEDLVEPAHGAFGLANEIARNLNSSRAVRVELAADVDGPSARDGAADVDRDGNPVAVIESDEAAGHCRPPAGIGRRASGFRDRGCTRSSHSMDGSLSGYQAASRQNYPQSTGDWQLRPLRRTVPEISVCVESASGSSNSPALFSFRPHFASFRPTMVKTHRVGCGLTFRRPLPLARRTDTIGEQETG